MNRTLSHTAIYSIGVVVGNITSLVMLPIYTRYLTPADYGLVELLSMLLDVTLIVFGMRADSGLFRYFHAFEDQASRNNVVSTTFFMTLGLNAIGAIFLVIFSVPIAKGMLGDSALWSYLAIFSISLLAPALIAVPYNYTRLLGRPWLFLGLSLGKLALQVLLNILFVVVLELKALGVIYSTVISQVVLGVLFSSVMLRKVGWTFSREIARKLVNFSIPLVISSLATFYVIYGDRFFLRSFWGLAAVGLYGLAYRFAFSMWHFVYEPFRKAWDVQKYEIYKGDNAQSTFQFVFGLVSKALLVAAFTISLFISDFLRLLVGPEFQSASKLVPILLAAYVVRPLSDYCNLGLLLKEKTKAIAQASWLSAVVMTAGFLAFIPRYGAAGAAFTALIGFSAELFWVHRASRQCYDMGLDWRRFFFAVPILVSGYLMSLLVDGFSVTTIATKILIFIVTMGLLYLSPATTARERGTVKEYSSIVLRRVGLLSSKAAS